MYLNSQLQELASQLIDLWNLMDTPEEERSLFDHVTCNISASVDEVTVPGALALDLIEQVIIISQFVDISENLNIVSGFYLFIYLFFDSWYFPLSRPRWKWIDLISSNLAG